MKGNWLSNKNLYQKTHQIEWSKKVAHMRRRFFGHITRLDENAPAKLALYEAICDTQRPQGSPKTTLLAVIKNS